MHRSSHLSILAKVNLLIGRDAGQILASFMKNKHTQFVYETPIGYAIVGKIPSKHPPTQMDCLTLRTAVDVEHLGAEPTFCERIFRSHEDDDITGLSANDRKFIAQIQNNCTVNESSHIEMPLPFRDDQISLPNNKNAIYYRQKNTLNRLTNEPIKLKECLEFMQKNINEKHVEEVPENERNDKNAWYISVFPVENTKKQTIRLVFDCAASYTGVSLNSVLLQGPDQNNNLRGVLIRFREDNVCYIADIQSMFHSFYVSPKHRNYMRFFWFDKNNSGERLTEYRARVHIFGNCCSPAIATMGLRKAADKVYEHDEDDDIKEKTRRYIYCLLYTSDAADE